jgi:tetratricopeptide (TPR) repeat protein
MAPPLLLALTGLLYILLLGGLSFLRREGLSARFAIEAVAITAGVIALSAVAGVWANPAILVALLYLVTMRVRLLIDVGNLLARRGDRQHADAVYRLALRLWPDEAGRLLVRLNQGVLALHNGRPDEAIATFEQVLSAADSGFLGPKHQSACYYNLGVAYLRKGLDAQATLAFNAVLDTWPASEYARYATIALERRKQAR